MSGLVKVIPALFDLLPANRHHTGYRIHVILVRSVTLPSDDHAPVGVEIIELPVKLHPAGHQLSFVIEVIPVTVKLRPPGRHRAAGVKVVQ